MPLPDRRGSGEAVCYICLSCCPELWCVSQIQLTRAHTTIFSGGSTCVMRLKPASVICWQRARSLMLLLCSSEESVVSHLLEEHSSRAESLFWNCTVQNVMVHQTPTPLSPCSSYLLKVVKCRENNFVASSHETNCRQELQDQSFGSVKQEENKKQEHLVNDKCQQSCT